jgi:hypothetical protein
VRRPFLVWLGDTACGLVAYVASRLLWQNQSRGGSTLLSELGTFAALYLLLQLVLRLAGSVRRRKREEAAARAAAAQALRRTPPPPPAAPPPPAR